MLQGEWEFPLEIRESVKDPEFDEESIFDPHSKIIQLA